MLGDVEGLVGSVEERIGLHGESIARGDARRGEETATVEGCEWALELALEACQHRFDRGLLTRGVEDEAELVPAGASDHVGGADGLGEAVGQLGHDLIPTAVSVRVVDVLEVVEVEGDDGDALTRTLRACPRSLEGVCERSTIREPRQGIAGCEHGETNEFALPACEEGIRRDREGSHHRGVGRGVTTKALRQCGEEGHEGARPMTEVVEASTDAGRGVDERRVGGRVDGLDRVCERRQRRNEFAIRRAGDAPTHHRGCGPLVRCPRGGDVGFHGRS